MRQLQVLDVRAISGSACSLEFDEFVPLRMRTYEPPLGCGVLRIGNYSTTLIELLVELTSQTLRGVTIVSIASLSPWPPLDIRSVTSGTVVLGTDFHQWSVVDLPIDFQVAVREDELLVHWGSLSGAEAYEFGRVRLLAHSGLLSAMCFCDLTKDEIASFRSHEKGAISHARSRR
jgi:hypothetical protein